MYYHPSTIVKSTPVNYNPSFPHLYTNSTKVEIFPYLESPYLRLSATTRFNVLRFGTLWFLFRATPLLKYIPKYIPKTYSSTY